MEDSSNTEPLTSGEITFALQEFQTQGSLPQSQCIDQEESEFDNRKHCVNTEDGGGSSSLEVSITSHGPLNGECSQTTGDSERSRTPSNLEEEEGQCCLSISVRTGTIIILIWKSVMNLVDVFLNTFSHYKEDFYSTKYDHQIMFIKSTVKCIASFITCVLYLLAILSICSTSIPRRLEIFKWSILVSLYIDSVSIVTSFVRYDLMVGKVLLLRYVLEIWFLDVYYRFFKHLKREVTLTTCERKFPVKKDC